MTGSRRHGLCSLFRTMLGVPVHLLVVAAVVLMAAPGHAQLCAPADNPCVVSTSVSVPGGSVIDLGGRDLVIAAGKDIVVQGTGTGSLVLTAHDITFQDGARIVAPGVGDTGGTITLTATGAVVMQPNSRIDTTGGSGGTIALSSATAILNGQLRCPATLREGEGGFVDVHTNGDLAIGGGGILATGGNGNLGFGGFLFVFAGGDIEITSLVESKGGDGGDVDIDALGDLRLAPTGSINNIATSEGNDGGDVSLSAGGIVTVDGPILSKGQGSLFEGGGYGGDLDVLGRRIVLRGQIELTGAGPDGDGGFLDATADEDILVTGSIIATGAAQGVGGEVDFYGQGEIALQGTIDVRGGFVGGTFSTQTLGPVVFAGTARVNADFLASGGYGGIIDVSGCDVTIPSGAVLSCAGLGALPRGLLRVSASNTMTIGGSLTAAAKVSLLYRVQPPTLLATASLHPSPVIQQQPTLPCCVLCNTTTSTTTTSSTTTSTSSTTVTTVTTVSSTSTSSSSSTSTSTSTSSSSTTTSTSTTTMTSTSTSTSSSASSSTVTTTLASTTTSTTLPLSCLDEPLVGYAAVECAIGSLRDMLAAHGVDELGGSKSAKRLAGKIAKTSALVEKARTASNAAKLLVKAERKVLAFDKQIARLLAKAKIEDILAIDLLDLSGEVVVRIDGVRTPPAS